MHSLGDRLVSRLKTLKADGKMQEPLKSIVGVINANGDPQLSNSAK